MDTPEISDLNDHFGGIVARAGEEAPPFTHNVFCCADSVAARNKVINAGGIFRYGCKVVRPEGVESWPPVSTPILRWKFSNIPYLGDDI